MTKREELLRSEAWYTTGIQNDLFRAVNSYIKDNGISRQEFAEKLGVSKGRMSQILNGDFNGRLDRLVELSLAAGKAPVLEFRDLGTYIAEDSKREARAKEARKKGMSVAVVRFTEGLESAHGVTYHKEDYTGSFSISAQYPATPSILNQGYGC